MKLGQGSDTMNPNGEAAESHDRFIPIICCEYLGRGKGASHKDCSRQSQLFIQGQERLS